MIVVKIQQNIMLCTCCCMISMSASLQAMVPLCRAVQQGDINLVRQLLSSDGIDVNQGDCDKETPLHWAALRGYVEIAKILLAAGADPDRYDAYGFTPLHWAVRGGCTGMVNLFVSGKKSMRALLLAQHARLGKSSYARELPESVFRQIFDLLKKTYATVDKKDMYGYTPLHVAAGRACIQMVQILLDAGANVGMLDRYRRTAVMYGNEEVVQFIETYQKAKKYSI
jgi:ankyrin repeat protein